MTPKPKQYELPDFVSPAGARAARDEGAANAGNWFHAACDVVAVLRTGWTGTGEDLRLYVTGLIGHPHTPHVWGALTAWALRNGKLIPTGERRSMQTIKSHARKTDVYRSS